MKPREEYDLLLSSGELQEVYSEYNLTGNWEKDKKKFLRAQEDNLRALEGAKNLYVDYDDGDF